ncbi:hypothetical protein [Bacillus sp. NEB1478]|uniref:hypothetical protein n=1 Tax=Bacillus sp. NEB1478 TaxID=3073816 RepID=UPI002873CA21|nr:hypothetical protein [Bacillus sp. NEB1478]WNB90626.1 hypothetical protein RGB74_11935 [Bacillus sp. NEB1478]
MKELVGKCVRCEKELFCMDGFFQAEVSDSGETFCFTCVEEMKKESNDYRSSNS